MTKINYKKINYKKYFDKIYCINLNQRPERWENCLAEFKKHNIKVERFSAIDGTKVEHYDNINIGAAGCFMSHLSIFKEMVKNNWSRVLILEDDVVFAKDFSKRIPNILNNLPPSFDVVYLGASYVIKGKEINPFLSKVVSAGTTSSYIVSLEFANKFLENYKEINCEIDVLFAKLQKKLNFFISNDFAYMFNPCKGIILKFSNHPILFTLINLGFVFEFSSTINLLYGPFNPNKSNNNELTHCNVSNEFCR